MTDLAADDRDLVLDRLLDAPRSAVWRAWTEPEILRRWFAPRPWTTPRAELDLRPGGACTVVMADEAGNEYPNPGVYLEVVENERLVFTDAYGPGWVPAAEPFMTGIITLADEGGKTRYIARARHWTPENRQKHESMGFQEGWGRCADQLEEVARSL